MWKQTTFLCNILINELSNLWLQITKWHQWRRGHSFWQFLKQCMQKIFWGISISQWRNIEHGCSDLRNMNGEKSNETSLLDFSPAASTGVKMVSHKTTHFRNKLSQTSSLSLSVSRICLCLSHILAYVTHFELSNSVLSTGITVKATKSYPYMTHRWKMCGKFYWKWHSATSQRVRVSPRTVLFTHAWLLEDVHMFTHESFLLLKWRWLRVSVWLHPFIESETCLQHAPVHDAFMVVYFRSHMHTWAGSWKKGGNSCAELMLGLHLGTKGGCGGGRS